MAIIYKPGVFTFVHLIKLICRFITKHQGTFLPVLQGTLSAGDYALVTAAIAAINAACAALDVAYPNIKA
jgi:hypothetical protein